MQQGKIEQLTGVNGYYCHVWLLQGMPDSSFELGSCSIRHCGGAVL